MASGPELFPRNYLTKATGFALLMFIFTMWIMLHNRQRRILNKTMLSASCALMILATAVRCVKETRVTALTRCIGNDGEYHPVTPRIHYRRAYPPRRSGAVLRGCLSADVRYQERAL